jgi:poly(A) polymerase
MDELERRLAELREHEELSSIRPQLDGNAVMKHLDVGPGPDVGAALDYLLQIRLDEGLLDEGEVLQRLEDWWQERSGSRPR